MRRRKRELSVFSMSTVDLFACATGAFILLTLVLLPYYLNIDQDIVRALRERLAATEAELVETGEELSATRAARDEARAERDASEAARRRADETTAACEAARVDARAELVALRDELARSEADLRAEIGSLNAANATLEGRLESCGGVEQKSFMLVLMSWSTADDIDLHVIDPRGERYYYGERTRPGSIASFEEDSVSGPGNEIWMHPQAGAGEYRVHYNYYRRRGQEAVTVRGSVFHQRGRTELPTVTLDTPTGDRHPEAPLVATVVVGESGEVTLR